MQRNKVSIDTSIARLIAYDLVKFDVCRVEVNLIKKNLSLTNKEVSFKDSIITTLGKQKKDLNLIIFKKDEMLIKQEEISKSFKKDLAKEKAASVFYKTLATLGVISTVILAVLLMII